MPTTKKWKTEKKLEIKKTGVLRSIGKQSGESEESVPKKKKSYGGKDLQKNEGFQPGRKE